MWREFIEKPPTITIRHHTTQTKAEASNPLLACSFVGCVSEFVKAFRRCWVGGWVGGGWIQWINSIAAWSSRKRVPNSLTLYSSTFCHSIY